MHCVSTYPLKPENANLKAILTLRENIDVMLDTVVMKQVSQIALQPQL